MSHQRFFALFAVAVTLCAHAAAPAPDIRKVTLANAPVGGVAHGYNLTPTSSPVGICRPGESAEFLVAATRNGRPAAGETVVLAVETPGAFPAQEVSVTLDAEGKARHAIPPPKRPGWIHVVAKYGAAKADAGAMYDLEAIRPSAPPPADFRAFWDAEIAALRKHPLQAKLTEVPALEPLKEKVRTWEFEITCPGPRPATGYISLPKNARPKSLPIIVGFNGAGDVPAYRSDHYGEVAIAMQTCKFGLPNGLSEKEYLGKYYESDVKDYAWRGLETPRNAFLKWMIVRNLRALEYAKSRPEWNGRDLLLNGESFGGGQALIMGALDPDVTFVSSCVPALCDHNAILAGRIINGYPQLWKPDAAGGLPVAARVISENARYFDAMNFCALYRPGQEVSVGTGYRDTMCPPDGVVAAYANIPANVKKYLWLNPAAGHDAGNRHAGQRIFELLGKP